MRIETKVKLVVYTLAAAFVFATFGRLFAGAPIPVDPHYPILVDRVPVRNSKPVMIWTAKEQWRNDRLFASSFQ